jgi:hypothetical protein
MPTLSFFQGILIQMFWGDHPPPHFHVRYAEFRGRYQIEPLTKLTGDLPPRVERLVLEWALLHQAELRQSWEVCGKGGTPSKIQGLL